VSLHTNRISRFLIFLNRKTAMKMGHDWINRELYPFRSRYFETAAGKLHYIDEGEGDPIVMVHGNPTWSFLYRDLIRGLSSQYRCIAMDHIGFGLSDKPRDFSYLPQEHAKHVASLIEHLKLKKITLVVQDWGGPIALSYALDKPKNVAKLIVMNTWMWPVHGDPHYERFSGFMGGPVGRFLIRRFNFFVNVVMKQAYGDKTLLTPEIHDHYRTPLAASVDRTGCLVFPKQIIASSGWLSDLWNRRDAIRKIPALILWGMKDIAFRETELVRWESLFSNANTIRFPDTGHYVQEEKHEELLEPIRRFLAS